MSDINNFPVADWLHRIARLARIVGVVMIVIAVTIYVQYLSAGSSSMYDKIPAVITAVTILATDTTILPLVGVVTS